MNPFEIEKKIKELTRRVCCAIDGLTAVAAACESEGSTPHTSVTFGDSGGELQITFAGGSGENLSTEFQLFRNNTFVAQDSILYPVVSYVFAGELPPQTGEGGGDNIILLYRASCEATEDGDGGWRVGYFFAVPPPE